VVVLRSSWLVTGVLAATAVAAWAQYTMTAQQLVTFIQSSLRLHHDDVKVAAYVKKIKLSDRLEDRKVEELQGMGAGPKTMQALRVLSTSSQDMALAPPPVVAPPRPVIPPPEPAEIQRILEEIIDNARTYSKTLPDYLCVEVTRKHFDPSGTQNWRPLATVQEQVSYVDHKEAYTVTMVNGRAVSNVGHETVGGSTLSGDFGSIYSEIFAPETATEFEWDHWATLRGRRTYVYAFRVPQSRSQFTIYDSETRRTVTAGYHGLVYADRESGMVMRYKFDCEDIPADFPVKDVKLDVNYDFIEIAGQKYVLPLKTEIWSRAGRYMTWNEAEFRLYRKFGTESSITFETPDPLPEDKTKEEPPVPDDPKKPVVKKQP
jgi:hypothetical protein